MNFDKYIKYKQKYYVLKNKQKGSAGVIEENKKYYKINKNNNGLNFIKNRDIAVNVVNFNGFNYIQTDKVQNVENSKDILLKDANGLYEYTFKKENDKFNDKFNEILLTVLPEDTQLYYKLPVGAKDHHSYVLVTGQLYASINDETYKNTKTKIDLDKEFKFKYDKKTNRMVVQPHINQLYYQIQEDEMKKFVKCVYYEDVLHFVTKVNKQFYIPVNKTVHINNIFFEYCLIDYDIHDTRYIYTYKYENNSMIETPKYQCNKDYRNRGEGNIIWEIWRPIFQ